MTPEDPFARFAALFEQARHAYPEEWNGMVLSTAGSDGRPSSRVVLLKSFDSEGFVFFTNYESRKGHELAHNPWAALCFWWPKIEYQVRIEGRALRVSDEESDAYFASRPKGSQLGAWASRQSEVLGNRDDLDMRVAELAREYENKVVPRPPHWGGLRLVPDRVEFWRNRLSRLHDREVYWRKTFTDPWRFERLYP